MRSRPFWFCAEHGQVNSSKAIAAANSRFMMQLHGVGSRLAQSDSSFSAVKAPEEKQMHQWMGILAIGGLALAGCDQSSGSANAQADSTVNADTSKMVSGPAGGAEKTPLPPPGKAPQQIRGIYINAYGAGSKARIAKLLAIADSTEINAFVIDVKDEKGVHYP